MNDTIALLIYWSMAAGLVLVGFYALKQGFKLVIEGKGRTKEKTSIHFLGLSASVGSIGAHIGIIE